MRMYNKVVAFVIAIYHRDSSEDFEDSLTDFSAQTRFQNEFRLFVMDDIHWLNLDDLDAPQRQFWLEEHFMSLVESLLWL